MTGPAGPWRGKRVVLSTKHDKLPLIEPPLASVLGMIVEDIDVDTDTLGTFSGESPRRGTARDAVLAKARLGMRASGVARGLASEGTISQWSFLPVFEDEELVIFVDDDLGLVLCESAVSTSLVAHSWCVDTLDVDPDDLVRAGFPEHGLIVRSETDSTAKIWKGIHNVDELSTAIAACRTVAHPMVRIQTDLRAHHCPSRRPTIAAAAERLAHRLAAKCPTCDFPGWGEVEVLRGLACVECAAETSLVRARVVGCVRCEHREVVRETTSGADPSVCPRCNP